MDFLLIEWVAFFITGLGTMFLIGEMLVNMRGIFALFGLGLIVLYYSVYLEPGSLMLMMFIYFVGILLVVIDGKFIGDGTLAIIGLVFMLVSVAIAAPNFYTGLYAVMGVLIGGFSSFLFLKFLPRRNMWDKITLKDRLTTEDGYVTMNEDYHSLIGREGKAVSVLRPVGTIQIDDQTFSAVTSGEWVDKDSKVKVVAVDGTKILVKQIHES